MGKAFTITATPLDVALAPGSTGRFAVTITNTTGLFMDGARVGIVPKDSTPKEWLSFVDDQGKALANQQPEETYAANESRQYQVQAVVPANAAPGAYGLRVDAVSVRQPNDQFETGPDLSVAVRAKEPEPGGSKAWIAIVAVAAVIVVGGAVAIILALNNSTPSVPVPQIVNLPFEQAVQNLESAGLRLGATTPREVAEGAANVVLEQDPKEGEVDAGTTVALVLSVRPPPPATVKVQVPKVEGRTQAEAIAVLTNAQLRYRVTLQDTNKVPDGVVLDQEPKEAKPVDVGSEIALVVERRPIIKLPDKRRYEILENAKQYKVNPALLAAPPTATIAQPPKTTTTVAPAVGKPPAAADKVVLDKAIPDKDKLRVAPAVGK